MKGQDTYMIKDNIDRSLPIEAVHMENIGGRIVDWKIEYAYMAVMHFDVGCHLPITKQRRKY